ncbi:hypothetical protein ACFLZZ_01710 [Nanoarchaeota archaeon]
MGVLSSFGLWISRSALIFFLIAAIFTAGLVDLTKSDTVNSAFESLVESASGGQLNLEELAKDIHPEVVNLCEEGNKETVSIPAEEGINLEFNCDDVKSKGVAEVKSVLVNEVISSNIPESSEDLCQEDNCLGNFVKTIISSPLQGMSMILDEDFNKAVSKLPLILFIIAILGAIGLVVFSSGISGRIMGLGYPLAVAGLPYFGLRLLGPKVGENLSGNAALIIQEILASVSLRFMIVLILGIALLVIGLILKFSLEAGKKKVGAKK